MNKLRDLHHDILTKLNQKRDHFSRLPIELQWKVYEDCLASTHMHADAPDRCKWCFGLGVGSLPTTIASVCQAWRAIALCTPFLWTYISFNIYSIHRDIQQDLILRLDRCGRLPLSVYIYESPQGHKLTKRGTQAAQPSTSDVEAHARTLLEFLSFRFHHVATLVIELPELTLRSFSGLSIPHAATLDEFHLHRTLGGRLSLHENRPVDFGPRFSARRVCMERFAAPRLNMDWKSVEQLVIRKGISDSTLPFLLRLPRVSRLDIEFHLKNNPVFPPLPTVMTTVKELILQGPCALHDICCTISAPSLTFFGILGVNEEDFSRSVPNILPFLGHCTASLTILDIGFKGPIPTLGPFISVVQSCTNITALTVRHDHLPGDSIFDSLLAILQPYANKTLPSSNSPLLPKLRTLNLLSVTLLDWNTVFDFISSRLPLDEFPVVEQIRQVSIGFEHVGEFSLNGADLPPRVRDLTSGFYINAHKVDRISGTEISLWVELP